MKNVNIYLEMFMIKKITRKAIAQYLGMPASTEAVAVMVLEVIVTCMAYKDVAFCPVINIYL